MSIHSGLGSMSPGSSMVEMTTTLFELMESMDRQISSLFEARTSGAGKKRPDPARDRVIARKIARMFLSGRLRFKHPASVRNTCPEWFE